MSAISPMPLLFLAMLLAGGCSGADPGFLDSRYAELEALPDAQKAVLSGLRIFFGHKSVGQNIVDGLHEVMARSRSIRLAVLETSLPEDFDRPVFGHASIGTNRDPGSKLARFVELMESGLGPRVDVAMLKLCFVDIDHTTDVAALFRTYADALTLLQDRFPDRKIVPMTVPLVSRPVGIRNRLKKILGRLPWEEDDNIKRNEFNDLLRGRFRDGLFDLAAIESRIDGAKRAVFRKNGREFELLYRPYTDDGGHLNSLGRQIVAIELLLFLANLTGPAAIASDPIDGRK